MKVYLSEFNLTVLPPHWFKVSFYKCENKKTRNVQNVEAILVFATGTWVSQRELWGVYVCSLKWAPQGRYIGKNQSNKSRLERNKEGSVLWLITILPLQLGLWNQFSGLSAASWAAGNFAQVSATSVSPPSEAWLSALCSSMQLLSAHLQTFSPLISLADSCLFSLSHCFSAWSTRTLLSPRKIRWLPREGVHHRGCHYSYTSSKMDFYTHSGNQP